MLGANMRKISAGIALLAAITVLANAAPACSYEINHPYFSTEQAKAFAGFVAQSRQKRDRLDRQIGVARSEAAAAQAEETAAQAELNRVRGFSGGGWLGDLGMVAQLTGFSLIANFLSTSFLMLEILSLAGFIGYIVYLRRHNRQKWALLTSGRKLAAFWTSRGSQTLSILIIAGALSFGLTRPASAQLGIFQQIEWRYFGTEIQKGYISLQYGPERPLTYDSVGGIPLYGPPYDKGAWYREFDRLAHVAYLHLPLTAENLKPLFAFGKVSDELDHLYGLIAHLEPALRAQMLLWRLGEIRKSATTAEEAIPELAQIASVLRAMPAGTDSAETAPVRAALATTLDGFAQKASGPDASTKDIFRLATIYAVISADKARQLVLSRRLDVDALCKSDEAVSVFKELAGTDPKIATGTLYDKNELFLLFGGKDISTQLRCIDAYAKISEALAGKIASVIDVSRFKFGWDDADRAFVRVINRYRPEERAAVYRLLVKQAPDSLEPAAVDTQLAVAQELGQKADMAATDILKAFLITTGATVSDAASLTRLFDAAGLSDQGLVLQVAGRVPDLAADLLIYLQDKSPALFYADLNQIARKDPSLLAKLRLPYSLIDLHQLSGYIDDDALKGFSSVPAYYFLLDHELREGKVEPAGLLLELEGMVETAFTPPGKETTTPAGFIDAFLTDDFFRRAATLGGNNAAGGLGGPPAIPAAIAQSFRNDAAVLDRFVALTLDKLAVKRRAELNADIAGRERTLASWRSRTQTLRSRTAELKSQISEAQTEQMIAQIKPTLIMIMTIVNLIATACAIGLSLNYALSVILACEHPKFLLIVAVFVETLCFFLLSQLNFAALAPLLLAQLLAVLARAQWPSTDVLYAAYRARVLGQPPLRQVA
jgi:hypothetical protein